jgi:hypothetical protein
VNVDIDEPGDYGFPNAVDDFAAFRHRGMRARTGDADSGALNDDYGIFDRLAGAAVDELGPDDGYDGFCVFGRQGIAAAAEQQEQAE